MNMYCASRLGWIRSSKEASPHAPEEVTDPAQAGSAASGRAPAGARAAASTRIRRRKPHAGAAFCFLAAALLLALPATVGAQVRGALVLSKSSVEINENGVPAQYTVRLNTQPASEVTVVVATGDEDIAQVSTVNTDNTFTTSVTLTFDRDTWKTPLPVFVQSQDDEVANPGGSRVVEITNTPSGAGYGTGDAKTVQAWVVNDDDPVNWEFSESSLLIDDEDGGTNTYTVVLLNSEPTSDVTVELESDNPSAATVSPTSLTFSPDAEDGNGWRTAQTITVTGVNDNVDNPPVDGTNDGRLARITHTPNGGGYDYIKPHSIEVTVMDNDGGDDVVAATPDTVGLTLTPSTTGNDDEPLKVDDEDGGRATYTVRLNTMPTATVTVFAESEEWSTATVSPLVLTFTRANWNQPQTVTVNDVNDDEDNPDEMRAVRITYASSGGDYDGVGYEANMPATTAWSVMVSVLDDDTAGLRLSSDVVRLDENGTKTYTVRLETKPTANVEVMLASNAEVVATVMPKTLTFSFANPSADNYWNKPQRVTVSAVADEVDNPNNRTTEITHTTSGDDKYDEDNDSTQPELLVTVEDDADTAALLISESAITVTEADAGNTGTYTVKLNSAPPDGDTVIVTLVLSGDTGLIGVAPTSLEFTGRQSATNNGDWDDPEAGHRYGYPG